MIWYTTYSLNFFLLYTILWHVTRDKYRKSQFVDYKR